MERAIAAARSLGGLGSIETVAAPASAGQVRDVEASLGIKLPDALARVFTEFSAKVHAEGRLDENALLTDFEDIDAGELHWDLEELPELERSRTAWVNASFPDPENPYDRFWQGKLAVLHVMNGDLLALDVERPGGGSLILLSQDGSGSHRTALGPDFLVAHERWSRLGFPGPEVWQWDQFVSSPVSGLEPDSEASRSWIEGFAGEALG